MLKLYDNDDRERASSVPNWKSVKTIMNAHRDSLKRIQYMDSFNRYISVSKVCNLQTRFHIKKNENHLGRNSLYL